MKFILLFQLLLFMQPGFSQNAPAAERVCDSEFRLSRNEIGRSEDRKKIKQEDQFFPVRHSLQKTKHKKRSYVDWDDFWLYFFVILGLLIWLSALASFFLFGILGWWVVLIALGGILVGCTLILIGEQFGTSKMAGLGAIIMGVLGLFGWLLGIIAVAIYNAIVN